MAYNPYFTRLRQEDCQESKVTLNIVFQFSLDYRVRFLSLKQQLLTSVLGMGTTTQSGLHSKFRANLNYIARPVSKKKKKTWYLSTVN